MKMSKAELKATMLSHAENLSAMVLGSMIGQITHHDVHLIHIGDEKYEPKIRLGKLLKAIDAGKILRTCDPSDESCEFFFYDDTAGVARTAWEAVELIDNVEALCHYVAHHREYWTGMKLTKDVLDNLFAYYKNTTYTPPVYKKEPFDDFEKVGRRFGLNDEEIQAAKELAETNFNFYKELTNENDRVISIVTNMKAIETLLNAKMPNQGFDDFDSEVDFHEDGGYVWYRRGVPIDMD